MLDLGKLAILLGEPGGTFRPQFTIATFPNFRVPTAACRSKVGHEKAQEGTKRSERRAGSKEQRAKSPEQEPEDFGVGGLGLGSSDHLPRSPFSLSALPSGPGASEVSSVSDVSDVSSVSKVFGVSAVSDVSDVFPLRSSLYALIPKL